MFNFTFLCIFVWSGIFNGYFWGPWQTELYGQTNFTIWAQLYFFLPPSVCRHSLIFIWILPKRILNLVSCFQAWQRECLISLTLLNTTNTQTSDTHIHTHRLTQVLQTNDIDKWVSLQQDCFQLCVHFPAQCKCNDALQSILPSLEIWKYKLLMLLQFLKLCTSLLSILWMNQSMKNMNKSEMSTK